MHTHEHFNLLLHDDDELAAILGYEIQQRKTLHEWPLSCVQKLILTNNDHLVYKAQSGPSVEPEFYKRAHSHLLCEAQIVYQTDDYACMIYDYIEAPELRHLSMSEGEIVRIGRQLLEHIREISGDLPFLFDASTPAHWQHLLEVTLNKLTALVKSQQFTHVTPHDLQNLLKLLTSDEIMRLFKKPTGYVHGDLTTSNVFILSDGYRVIDWAFPRLGPREFDLANLLDSAGIDPAPYVESGVIKMYHFMNIVWLIECATLWFIPGVPSYDKQIAQLIKKITG